MNLSNGRPALVRPFGKDVRNICPKNLMVKQFKSIFSGFDILPKRLKQARSLPLVSVSFSRRDVPVSLFFFRRNCFEKEEPEKLYSKAATTPDSLHSTRITVFRGFQTWKSWIWSILKYFQTWEARIWSISKYSQTWKSTIWSILKLQMWGICQQTENLHRKIHISTNAAILHSWIILFFCDNAQCRKIHTISQPCDSLSLQKQAAQK